MYDPYVECCHSTSILKRIKQRHFRKSNKTSRPWEHRGLIKTLTNKSIVQDAAASLKIKKIIIWKERKKHFTSVVEATVPLKRVYVINNARFMYVHTGYTYIVTPKQVHLW